jgi:acyl-CoA thioesterase-1
MGAEFDMGAKKVVWHLVRYLLGIVTLLYLAGCAPAPEPAPPGPEAFRAEEPAAPVDGPVIVAFGDSLTAGYGVPEGESYPDFLQQELLARGYRYRVINEGVSGDTTAVALQRIDFALDENPKIVVLALGGNDGLRGLPADAMEANLREMVALFRASGAQVVLAGMTLPPNFGTEYIGQFAAVFPRVARETGAKLIPFLLEGVAAVPGLNQEDGIHPTAAGNRVVAKTVADFLEPMLERGPGS